MLGEITHLQGIIDDLVVLTADPHKLPPASEQVRPALGSRVRTRTSEEMVLPSRGDSRKKREGLWEEVQIVSDSPCGISGSTCSGDGLKCSEPRKAQTDTDGQKPGPWGLALPNIEPNPSHIGDTHTVLGSPCGWVLLMYPTIHSTLPLGQY